MTVSCEDSESECKEYQQLEEKFRFLPQYEETGTPRDIREQMIMFFFISKFSKYRRDFASSCSNNEYAWPGLDPFSRHGGYLELGLASGYIEGRDPCPDYIII